MVGYGCNLNKQDGQKQDCQSEKGDLGIKAGEKGRGGNVALDVRPDRRTQNWLRVSLGTQTLGKGRRAGTIDNGNPNCFCGNSFQLNFIKVGDGK